jgi:hypothetical protein
LSKIKYWKIQVVTIVSFISIIFWIVWDEIIKFLISRS